MTPEEAVATHLDLRGGLLVPVHWATFNLAPHSWSEPVDRIWQEANANDVRLLVPRPGEPVNVDDPSEVDGGGSVSPPDASFTPRICPLAVSRRGRGGGI